MNTIDHPPLEAAEPVPPDVTVPHIAGSFARPRIEVKPGPPPAVKPAPARQLGLFGEEGAA